MVAHTVGELKAKLAELDNSTPICCERSERSDCSGRELRPVRVSKVRRNIASGSYVYPNDDTFNTILLEC